MESIDIFECVKQGNQDIVKEWLAAGTDSYVVTPEGQTLVHLAVGANQPAILELILRHNLILLNVPDVNGDTPLHVAARDSAVEIMKLLLSFGAEPAVMNQAGKQPLDLTKMPEMKALLAERLVASTSGRSVQSYGDAIRRIEAELPTDVASLKQFTLELIIANDQFESRCKDAIRQLIEEKHKALHSRRLLENALRLKPGKESDDFLSRLDQLQSENETHVASIGYLQMQVRMFERQIRNIEEYYRKSLVESAEAYQLERKILSERMTDTEKQFLDSEKQLNDELTVLRRELLAAKERLANGGSEKTGGDIELLLSLQNENQSTQIRIKELQTERSILIERLKTAEQLKALHEQELHKMRNDLSIIRKIMNDATSKALTESKNESDDRDEETGAIVFVRGENGGKQIKGATVEKLVERLTDNSTFDSQFLSAFMLTFRSFTDTNTFLNSLVKRYKENLTSDSGTNSKSAAPSPIQLRVANTLKYWIENYWEDFKKDQALLERLIEFMDLIKLKTEKLYTIVNSALSKKQSGQENKEKDREEKLKNATPAPKALVPKSIKRPSTINNDLSNLVMASKSDSRLSSNWSGLNLNKIRASEEIRLKFTDIEPLEMARQLTLIEYELFFKIQPTEFMNQAWMKEDKEIKAPNICAMTKWSNHVTRWVVSEIVSVKDLKPRAAMFERFIMLAHNLEKLNNFNGVKEILAGLQSSSIYRLKKTKEVVSSKHLKIFEELNKLASSELNFKLLRAKIHAVDPPLIPFPGVYQGDLVFLDTCSRSTLENGLVNFLKFQKIASYIIELQVYQQTPYNLEGVPEICSYVRNFTLLSDDEAWAASQVCEPRM